jgi:hypothetical protein
MRGGFAALVGLVVFGCGRAAFAECDDLAIDNRVSLGFLVPMPDCPVTLHGDVGFELGDTYPDLRHEAEESVDARLFAELGVLFAADESSRVHVGPLIAIAGLNDPRTGDFTRTELAGLVHVRWWTPGDILTLDASAGPTMTFSEDRARPGVYASFYPGIHGVFGVGVSYDHVFLSEEHRVMLGVHMTGVVAAYAVCLMSGSKC